MYVGFKIVLLGVKLPVPELNQTPLPVVDVPFRVKFGLFLHTVCGLNPALTIGAGDILTVILSLTGKQLPFPVLDRVSINEPEVISAALGR